MQKAKEKIMWDHNLLKQLSKASSISEESLIRNIRFIVKALNIKLNNKLNITKLLDIFIFFAQIVLVISAIIDAYLWFTKQYLIPCFTVTLFSICFLILFAILRYFIKKSI